MNLQILSRDIRALTKAGESHEAEVHLLEAYNRASHEKNDEAVEFILSMLVQFYASLDPPEPRSAAKYSLRRERLFPSAYNRLQTGMLQLFLLGDTQKAVRSFRAAINKGTSEDDYSTVYSSLSLLGVALLDLHQLSEAIAVFHKLQDVVASNRPVMVGDETLFLERMQAAGLAVDAVRQLAQRLSPLCQDPEFQHRLKALSSS